MSTEHAHFHPTWKEYKWVALWLFVITIAEVWAYYIPVLVQSAYFVPSILAMMVLKFAIVVMYYMHLKYDHSIFRRLFLGPLAIAGVTLIAFLFLFNKVVVG